MQINIYTFGIAREICGGSSISVELPEAATAADLRVVLTDKFPRLGQLKTFLLAVNEEYAAPDTPVGPQDEIAIIPPVSGG